MSFYIFMFWNIWAFIGIPFVGLYLNTETDDSKRLCDVCLAFIVLIFGPLSYFYIWYLKSKNKE